MNLLIEIIKNLTRPDLAKPINLKKKKIIYLISYIILVIEIIKRNFI